MRRVATFLLFSALLVAGDRAATAAGGEPCTTTEEFPSWLRAFRAEAESVGISRKTIAAALDGVTADPRIISRDRRQGFFWQSFLDFSDKLATANRVTGGTAQIRRHRAVFTRAEADYGVPAEVIASFWALESDFGAVTGKEPILRSLATLAWDCRRGEMFRGQLLDALRIIDRGDLKPREMIGSWAGELGQTQFLPSHYLHYGVDYDGDGRRDLLRSADDVIGSSAAYLAALGWRRHEPWIEEVRVPAQMAWEEADLDITHPRSYWGSLGLVRGDGSALEGDTLLASLLLPMGRHGPAFLAFLNFRAYLEWNHSENYALTAAWLATRIAGAPPMHRGDGSAVTLPATEIRTLQGKLLERHHPIGATDGKLGAATRAAVRKEQLRLGLPADAWPTAELLKLLSR